MILSDASGLDALWPYLEQIELSTGDHLITQGAPADSLYFVESGQVTAQLEYPERRPVRLETMGRGRVVGEIGFYLGQTRTAAVVADEPSTVYRLNQKALERMESEAPEAASALHRLIIHLLSERVNHLVSTVKALER